MIDLHCHLLPGIDDGAPTLDVSLAMARMAIDDGVTTIACTPHIYPGMYMNDKPGIEAACRALQRELDQRGMPLTLVTGADVHLVPGLIGGLAQGRIPTLHGSRYLLLEPSHTTPPPRFEDAVFNLIASGYTPVITHPERLAWVEHHYEVFLRLIGQGAWMQVTAGALTGVFGPRARYWAERFVGEGHTHILASDAHSAGRRNTRLSPAREAAERLLGADEARRLLIDRPQAILNNEPPDRHPLPEPQRRRSTTARRWWPTWWRKT